MQVAIYRTYLLILREDFLSSDLLPTKKFKSFFYFKLEAIEISIKKKNTNHHHDTDSKDNFKYENFRRLSIGK